MYAQVAVAAPVRQIYTYLVPSDLAESVGPGHLVEVPFGKKRIRAIVLSCSSGVPDGTPADLELKPIQRQVEQQPVIRPGLLRTLQWSADYYLVPLGEMIFSGLPPQFRKPQGKTRPPAVQMISLLPAASADALNELGRRAPRQAQLLELLKSDGPQQVSVLQQRFPAIRSAIQALAAKGLIEVTRRSLVRTPSLADLPLPAPFERLTDEQQTVIGRLRDALQPGGFQTFLLHGVTGSGKTEVYLRAIAQVLEAGKDAILLVPEISLTPQLVSRVTDRFGRAVAVLHSGLADGERLDEWRRLQTGAARVVVGARSAVFAPVRALGLVVVDEEHDGSYKQSERLPYQARDLAIVRAREEEALALLGTATPSVESYAQARSGRYRLLELTHRVNQRSLPTVQVEDLRNVIDPIERGHTIGPVLAEALAEVLDRGEQAILFLNRRGYSSFVLCKDCGQAVQCKHCSVALVHHLKEANLRCHYCGLTSSVPTRCPSCERGRVQLFGLGTEKCEEEVRRRFPGVRVLRVDSDSATAKGALPQMMSDFAQGRADVLVGTQMITKGHDVPGVTLVGVLAADLGLNLPDFRAAERTFQQLMQVAGRAGRGDRPGKVVIQTFLPEHPSITLARQHRYADFFELEMARRTSLGYPPAQRLLMIRISHPDPDQAARLSRSAADAIRRAPGGGIQLLGPVPSPLARLRGRYRWQMLLRSPSVSRLHQVALFAQRNLKPPSGAKIIFDVDPVDML